MFDLILAMLGLGMLPMLGVVDDPPEDPPEDPPQDPAAGNPEPTADEIYEQWKAGKLHDSNKTNEIVQDRLARDRKNRETEAEKERKRQETEALKEQEKYKEAYESAEKSRQELEGERDAAKQTLNAERTNNALQSALRDAGINSERIGPALRIADTLKVSIADDGTVSGVDKVVEAVKTDSPEWFESSLPPAGSPRTPRTPPQAPSEEDNKKAQEKARRSTRAAF